MNLNEIKKEDVFVRNLGVVRFPRTKLTLSDIEFRKECFSVLTPLSTYIDHTHYGVDYDYFVCYSPLFREIEEGIKYPEYEITLKREGDKIYIVEVREIDKNNIIL